MFPILDSIRKMFTRINYSDKGHNNRELEETAFMYFTDYLDECEKGAWILMISIFSSLIFFSDQ